MNLGILLAVILACTAASRGTVTLRGNRSNSIRSPRMFACKVATGKFAYFPSQCIRLRGRGDRTAQFYHLRLNPQAYSSRENPVDVIQASAGPVPFF
jgi:hypothetical protein